MKIVKGGNGVTRTEQYIMKKKKNSGLIFDSAPGLMKETFVVTEPGNRVFLAHKSFVPGGGMF